MAAAAVLPLLAYGAISIVSLRNGAQQAVTQGNLNVARRASEQIELYLTNSVKILKAVAADTVIQKATNSKKPSNYCPWFMDELADKK